MSWEPFDLFKSLLGHSDALLEMAKDSNSTPNPEASLPVRMAFVGFYQYSEREDWTLAQVTFIEQRVQGELSDEALIWWEECAEPVRLFFCLALGAMLGLMTEGQLADTGFLLGDAHLAGFTTLHSEAICQAFHL